MSLFNFNITVHHHLKELDRQLLEKIMAALDDLTTEVEDTKTVQQSAVTLLGGLKTKLDEAIAAIKAGDNGAKLAELSSALDTSTNELAAAVTANTPADPANPTNPTDTPTT